jgi:hypothetical protein
MNIERLKRVGKWTLDKLADAIVYLLNLWSRFLESRGWGPRLKI